MFLSISVSTNVWDEDSQFKEIKFSHSPINTFEWTVNVRDCDEWPKDEWKQISAAMNGEKVGFGHLTPCIVSFGKMRKIGTNSRLIYLTIRPFDVVPECDTL